MCRNHFVSQASNRRISTRTLFSSTSGFSLASHGVPAGVFPRRIQTHQYNSVRIAEYMAIVLKHTEDLAGELLIIII